MRAPPKRGVDVYVVMFEEYMYLPRYCISCEGLVMGFDCFDMLCW